MHSHTENCYLQYLKGKEGMLDVMKQFSGSPNVINLTK